MLSESHLVSSYGESKGLTCSGAYGVCRGTAAAELKVISALLGHASVKTTADIYVHLLPKKATEEVDKLSEIDKLLAQQAQCVALLTQVWA